MTLIPLSWARHAKRLKEAASPKAKALRTYERALHQYDEATSRQDTRAMKHTGNALRDAMRRRLEIGA